MLFVPADVLKAIFSTSCGSFCVFQQLWTKARFRRRTFHEPNLIRIKADPRPAELIQTPILSAAELSSRGEKCSFRSNYLQKQL